MNNFHREISRFQAARLSSNDPWNSKMNTRPKRLHQRKPLPPSENQHIRTVTPKDIGHISDATRKEAVDTRSALLVVQHLPLVAVIHWYVPAERLIKSYALPSSIWSAPIIDLHLTACFLRQRCEPRNVVLNRVGRDDCNLYQEIRLFEIECLKLV